MEINEYPVRETIQDTDKFLLQTAAGATCGALASKVMEDKHPNIFIVNSKISNVGWYNAFISNKNDLNINGIIIIQEIWETEPGENLVLSFASYIGSKPKCSILSKSGTQGLIDKLRIVRNIDHSKYYLQIHYKATNKNSIYMVLYNSFYGISSIKPVDNFEEFAGGSNYEVFGDEIVLDDTALINYNATTLDGSTKEEILEQTTKVYSGTANPTNDIGKTGDLYFKVST